MKILEAWALQKKGVVQGQNDAFNLRAGYGDAAEFPSKGVGNVQDGGFTVQPTGDEETKRRHQ